MRVVGYYASFNHQDMLEHINLDALTQINYSFLLPRSDGTLYFLDEENVRHVVSIAHQKGIKIFVSVGGWSNEKKEKLSSIFETIMNRDELRKDFLKNVLEIVKEYDFDGVDFDWEFPTKEYQKVLEEIITKLSKSLHQMKKELSMAIYFAVDGDEKYNWISAISNLVISKLDFFGIMTYDDEAVNHSSLELAEKCVEYWVERRKVSKEKILIGIPFYSRPSAFLYSELIALSAINATNDYYGIESYNGIPTVRRKTFFAKEKCGGLIIWAINYDVKGKDSLLNVVQSAL